MYHLPIHKNTIFFLINLIYKAQQSFDSINSILKKYDVIKENTQSLDELKIVISQLSDQQVNQIITDDQFAFLKISVDKFFTQKMQEDPNFFPNFITSIKQGDHEKWEEQIRAIEENEKNIIKDIHQKIKS